mgnify:CR=1 FL=1
MSTKDVSFNTGQKLPIKQFKLTQLSSHKDLPAMLFIAPRGSGKTVLCQTILNHFKHIPVGLIIAPTDRMNASYSSFFWDSYIYYDFEVEIMNRLLARQKKMIRKCKEANKRGKSVDPRCFLVMDDCLASSKVWEKEYSIKEIMYNGRHYQIAYMLTMQYPVGIHPSLRTNFDYVFMFYEAKVNQLKKYYDHYAGVFPTFDSFKQSFTQLTKEKGSCMVLANKSDDKSFHSTVYWYRAPWPVVTQDIGCKEFIEYHKRNYNKNWEEDMDDENIKDDDPVAGYLERQKKTKGTIKIDMVDNDDNKNYNKKSNNSKQKSYKNKNESDENF